MVLEQIRHDVELSTGQTVIEAVVTVPAWFGDEQRRATAEAHPPPAPGGHRIKLKFITQAKTRPPGFVIKCSRADELSESYKRYLVNGLRDHFDMPGTPIRLFLRSQGNENPWKDRKFHTPSRLRKHKEKNTGQ